jgi:hypothetical protein
MPVRFHIDLDKTMAALRYLLNHGLPSYQALELLAQADRRHLIQFGRPLVSDGAMDGPAREPDIDVLAESDQIHLMNILAGHPPSTYEQAFPAGSAVLVEITEQQEINEMLLG